MIQHRMVRKAELAGDPRRALLGLDAVELNAMIDFGDLDAIEHAEEVEVPPRAAKLAVGRDLQADVFLLLDDGLDFAVLDLLERRRADLALFPLGPRFFQRGGAQQAADNVGAERRLGPFHRRKLLTKSNGNKRSTRRSSTANMPARNGPCPIGSDPGSGPRAGCGQSARFGPASLAVSRRHATSARAESGKWSRFSENIMRLQNVSGDRLHPKRSRPDMAGSSSAAAPRPSVGL